MCWSSYWNKHDCVIGFWFWCSILKLRSFHFGIIMCMPTAMHSFSPLTYAWTRWHHSPFFLISLPLHMYAHTHWIMETKNDVCIFRPCLVPLGKIFKIESFHIWSIKYRLITKLITELVCKLRDESNKKMNLISLINPSLAI